MAKSVIARRKKMEFVIHPYDKRISAIHRLIERQVSQYNAKLIQSYDQYVIRLSLAKATRLKHLQIILNLTRFVGKNWNDVTKEDIDNLVLKVVETYGDATGRETNTTYDHKKILKIFFRWTRLGSRDFKQVGDPPETKDVRMRPVKNQLVREDLITKEEYKKLILAADKNPRAKALIAVHYEAGTRPGEILSLQLKHVKFDKFGAIISVDGKTGPRKIRLLKSIPYLKEWINVHPMRNNNDAPLWIQVEGRSYGLPLNYTGTKQLLERLCRKAGIEKRITLNLFRHTTATSLANSLPESLLRKRQGWTASSKMPERYVHLIDEDLDEAYLRLHGIIKEDKSKDIQEDLPIKCGLCGGINMPLNKICSECSRPLDLETAIQEEEKEQKVKESLDAEIKRQGQAIEYLLSEFQKIKKN
jgi:integrase